jgi:serine phosphatase RsbU (regulator of sigma subunit)
MMQPPGAADVTPPVHGKRRFGLIFALTIFVVSVAIGYLIGRSEKWHQRGWTGVYYVAGPNAASQAQFIGIKEYEVMMTVSGSPADGKLLFRDEVLTINGIARDDRKALEKLDQRLHRGDTVVYKVRRGNQVLDVPLRFESPLKHAYVIVRIAAALLVALTFITIALLIIARAPTDSRAIVFYAFALISAVALIGQAATICEQSQARGIIYDLAPAAATVMILGSLSLAYPPLILHLALIFPRKRPIVENHPYVLRWIYATVLLMSVSLGLSIFFLRVMSNVSPDMADRQITAALKPIINGLMIFSLAVLAHVLWAGRKEGAGRALARRPFRSSIATIGLVFGFARLASALKLKIVAGILGGLGIILPMLVILSFPFLAFVALYRSYRSANVEEKRQVTWPLWGLLITIAVKILIYAAMFGMTAFLALAKQDMIAWRNTMELMQLIPLLVTVLIPVSFGFAIFKYRLMNIDVIIRKTVVYAILSTAILVVYLGVVGGLGSLLVTFAGVQNQTLVIISTLVVGILFVPVRNKLQTLVDRNLFRHKYDYPEALRAVTNLSRGATDTAEFLNATAEKLQQALQNRAVVVFMERQEEFVAAAKVGVSDTLLGRLGVPRSFGDLLDRPFDPRKRTLPGEASAALSRVGTVLVVPAGNRAFIAAAAKLQGGELDVEDVDFLRSAADQVENALDRIRMQVEEADFAQARAIQQTLLPREMPRIAKLDISGIWQPARTMGGDYYDLLKLGENELAVCIGDVAGKGMPAALLMSGLQAAVRSSASSSPRDLCERVRRVVVSSLSGGRFVTFFYATVDTAAMTLRWCNAGHNAPILARADGTIVRLAEGGPAFSRLFKGTYEEREIPLLPGDRLVLFTDGVSESADANGELFGEQRIEELVAATRDLGAHELQQTIVHASAAYSGGEIEDDVTLVVVAVAA